MGRSRSTASVSARRVESMTLAGEASRSSERSRRAACVTQRIGALSGEDQRCWYQPGDAIPAP